MEKLYLNDEWFFSDSSNEIDMFKLNKRFEKIRIPHTIKEIPFNYVDENVFNRISYYQRELKIARKYLDCSIYLVFEGIAHQTDIYLNNKKLLRHNCGYTSFKVDITKEYNFNKTNILTVIVNSKKDINIPPFGGVIDYLTYGGIYRDVYLEVGDKRHIEDVYVNASYNGQCNLDSEITLSKEAYGLDVIQTLRTINGKIIEKYKINNFHHISCKALPWDVDSPNLYILQTDLLQNNKIIDSKQVKIGFRTLNFKKDGLYLNGKKVHLRGLNRHQTYPYVGYAMPKSMQYLDAKILKQELGLNAVRTSHYAQSQDFYDACDELGLLVFTEIPGWQYVGDYIWKRQALDNLKDMVVENRNHPSIFIWGVRINESADDDDFYTKTNDLVHSLDYRPTTGVRCIVNSSLLEDVYSFNDFSYNGKNNGVMQIEDVTKDTNKPYLITEYCGHTFPTKSFDDEQHRTDHMLRHAKVLNDSLSQENIAGTFGWCFADYNTNKEFGAGDKICYHGVLDMFRNRKLASYIYTVQNSSEPILELSSSFNIGDYIGASIKKVYAITNADVVKLYKNDVLINTYEVKNDEFNNLVKPPVIIDDFIGNQLEIIEKFSANKAKLIKKIIISIDECGINNLSLNTKFDLFKASLFYKLKQKDILKLYNKYVSNWGSSSTNYRIDAVKNNSVIKSIIRKPSTKHRLNADVSSFKLVEGKTYDVSSIRISIEDEYGKLLSYCNEPITFETKGSIELIGPSITSIRGGLSGTYVKSVKTGNGTLTIKALNQELNLNFNVVKA